MCEQCRLAYFLMRYETIVKSIVGNNYKSAQQLLVYPEEQLLSTVNVLGNISFLDILNYLFLCVYAWLHMCQSMFVCAYGGTHNNSISNIFLNHFLPLQGLSMKLEFTNLTTPMSFEALPISASPAWGL